jgi:hypothetical protein
VGLTRSTAQPRVSKELDGAIEVRLQKLLSSKPFVNTVCEGGTGRLVRCQQRRRRVQGKRLSMNVALLLLLCAAASSVIFDVLIYGPAPGHVSSGRATSWG